MGKYGIGWGSEPGYGDLRQQRFDCILADKTALLLHGICGAAGCCETQQVRHREMTGEARGGTRHEGITRSDRVAALDMRYRDTEQALAAASYRTGCAERDDSKGDAIIQKCLHLTDNIGLVFDGTAAQSLDLILIRLDKVWPGLDALSQALAARVQQELPARSLCLLAKRGVKVHRHTARQAARCHDDIGSLQELCVLRLEGRKLPRHHHRTGLEKLGLGTVLRDNREAGTRLASSLYEVAPDAVVLYTVRDELARLAAEPARHERVFAENGIDIGHMEALAARRIINRRNALHLTLLQVGQGITLIDGSIQIEYENHGTILSAANQ